MGVIIWQMLTLQPVPYAETGLVAVMDGVRDGTLDLRATLPRSAPWALLSALAYRCLDPDPSLRPSCARAMQVLDAQCHYARQQPVRVDTSSTQLQVDLSLPLLSMKVGMDGAMADQSQPAMQTEGSAGSSSQSSMYLHPRTPMSMLPRTSDGGEGVNLIPDADSDSYNII
jgi:hypothetical protein